MKNMPAAIQVQPATANPFSPAAETHQNQMILISLMAPFALLVFNTSVFEVTLPAIRDVFQIQADVVAWIMTVYNLPFMVLMPLYGRLGDELGQRRLFIFGILMVCVGTIILFGASSLSWFMVGRAVQGAGSAGLVPLCMAIISQVFPAKERGKALGTWNSIGPVTNITAPLLTGVLIDYLNWRLVFTPVVLIGLGAIWMVWKQTPANPGRGKPGALRAFDWGGVGLLAGAVTMLMFYLSSQTITGIAPLRDWRLLLVTALLFGLFIVWEKRQTTPYIALDIFANRTFTQASICAGLRMFAMSAIGFLVPLYLADIHHLSAASTGMLLVGHAGALLVTMRVGGQWADRWNSRWPVVAGMAIQVSVMVALAVLPAESPLELVAGSLILHGMSAGLSLAALHRASLGKLPANQAGIAAGLYSMVRFTGTMLGPALGGIILQQGLDQGLSLLEAYQVVFWLTAVVTLGGVLIGWGLEE
jgi:EmrB/QacA subfamily drug resistance transporter